LPPKVKLTGFVADPTKNYTATMKTNLGTIVMALDAKNAPKAAGRFIELARGKFYDGLTIHRVAKDFVIQGGDPKGDGTGNSGNPPVVGEVPKDHYPVGALAGAKGSSDPAGTFDSQFFIVTGSKGATLPNDYARFGLVTSGMDVVQKIAALAPSSGDGPPTQKVTIDSITITES
jgi:peptidyl-prolyl cis-trans isomerase B (cyclophilin B)